MKIFKTTQNFSFWPAVALEVLEPIPSQTNQQMKKVDYKLFTNQEIRDQFGQPLVFNSVKQAEELLVDENYNNEYLPIEGLESFIQASNRFTYGKELYNQIGQNIAGCQVLGNTGALRLGLEFIKKFLPSGTPVLFPSFTWPNHQNIARMTGLRYGNYRYFNEKEMRIDIQGLLEDLKKCDNGSIVVFHACAHNPYGCSLDQEQWDEIQELTKEKQLLPFFDLTYQGISQDVNKDAFPIQKFAKAGIPLLTGTSYSYNMTLYGQRVGCLSFLCENELEKKNVLSQLNIQARGLWASPPLHGTMIANKILNTPELYHLWLQELRIVAERIQNYRIELHQRLQNLGSPFDWSHLSQHQGLFAYTGLNQQEILELDNNFLIKLMSKGRLSMSGLNDSNIDFVAEAINTVTRKMRKN